MTDRRTLAEHERELRHAVENAETEIRAELVELLGPRLARVVFAVANVIAWCQGIGPRLRRRWALVQLTSGQGLALALGMGAASWSLILWVGYQLFTGAQP